MLPEMMSLREEIEFCEDLVLQMAKDDEYLAHWFHRAAYRVVATELGWPLQPGEARLSLAEVESKLRPYLSEPDLLPFYQEVIRKCIEQGKNEARQTEIE